MAQQVRKTILVVDEDLCTGCGDCAQYCLMNILEVDDICTITANSKCLVCGFCVRKCPENAIQLQEVASSGEIEYEAAGQTNEDEKVDFRQVLDSLFAIMQQETDLVQTFDFEGLDIRPLDNFDIVGEKCYTRCYNADKLEKVGFTYTSFYGLTSAQAVGFSPAAEYDFPFYVMDWTEAEDSVFVYLDLVPADDPGRNRAYLAEYLHDPLEDIYQKYVSLPGLEPVPYHWLRAVSSPYVICGTVTKGPEGYDDRLFDCTVEYLRAWIELLKRAAPKDPSSDYMKLVASRKKTVREVTRENDPAAGTLDKFVEENLAHAIMKVTMP